MCGQDRTRSTSRHDSGPTSHQHAICRDHRGTQAAAIPDLRFTGMRHYASLGLTVMCPLLPRPQAQKRVPTIHMAGHVPYLSTGESAIPAVESGRRDMIRCDRSLNPRIWGCVSTRAGWRVVRCRGVNPTGRTSRHNTHAAPRQLTSRCCKPCARTAPQPASCTFSEGRLPGRGYQGIGGCAPLRRRLRARNMQQTH